MSEHIVAGATSPLGTLISEAEAAVLGCRVMERSPEGLRDARRLLLDATNDLASYLAARAVELESE